MLIGQVGENGEINSVLSKALGVLGHAEFFEPMCNLLHGGPPTVSSWHHGVFDHCSRESTLIYPRYHASDSDFRHRFPSISGRNWDFHFGRSLRLDGTSQRRTNVEHTLVWPTNPAGGARGTKIGIAAPPEPQNMPLSF